MKPVPEAILEFLRANLGTMPVEELAKKTGLSPVTVRRKVKLLRDAQRTKVRRDAEKAAAEQAETERVDAERRKAAGRPKKPARTVLDGPAAFLDEKTSMALEVMLGLSHSFQKPADGEETPERRKGEKDVKRKKVKRR